MSNSSTLLTVTDLNGWYDESHVLHGISLDVREGEVVTLLGRNGAGKSTTLKAIMGVLTKRSGSVRYDGAELIRRRSDQIAARGIAYCPEERAIFSSLSVEENLMLPPNVAAGGMSADELFDIFPNLAQRRTSPGTMMSGGEQQMLAIARILRTGAKLLLLDEPTEGLAPVIVQRIGEILSMLKARGYTILLVEQNSRFAAKISDRHYILEHGRIVETMSAEEFPRKQALIQSYLGV
jgi:branched-chain amino acid transport system ATP-binding protein